MRKINSIFTIIVACCYGAMGVFILFYPEFVFSKNVARQLVLLHENPPIVLNYIFWAISGVAALVAVPAITSFITKNKNTLIQWGERLALLGYSVIAISNFRAIAIKPEVANTFVNSDEGIRNIITMVDPWLLLGPKGYITLGAIGVWVLIISISAILNRKNSKIINIMGLVLALTLILSIIGLKSQAIVLTIEIIKGTVSCIWFLCIGISMCRKSEAESI